MGSVPSKWISKPKFKELEIGDRVKVNHIIGDCEIIGEPTVKNNVDHNGDKIKMDLIPVQFLSGPMATNKFNGKTMLVRQQIARKL